MRFFSSIISLFPELGFVHYCPHLYALLCLLVLCSPFLPLPRHSEALLPVLTLAQLPTITHQWHQGQSGLKIKNELVIKEACCHDNLPPVKFRGSGT